MRKSLWVTVIVATVIVIWSGCSRSGQETQTARPGVTPETEEAALVSVNAWLELVDTGKYDESWEQSASLFQQAVDKAAWHKQLAAVRTPLGELVGRKVKSSEYRTSLPGAPDGEYVVILYDTSFEHKKSAVETVTPMKEPDEVWRVSGYYIK